MIGLDRFRGFLQVRRTEDVPAALLLHLNIVIYACAFWLTQPLLPYMTSQLGADRVTFGYLQSCLEIAQVASSLYFGQVIDKLGPRSAMALSQFGTSLAYLLLAIASSTTGLFISRIPTVFMACMLCAQGTLPQYCDDNQRAAALGRLSVSYLLGMIVGSSCGGVLSNVYGYQAVGLLAMSLSVIMGIVSFFTLPDLKRNPSRAKTDENIRIFSALQLCTRASLRSVVVLLLVGGSGIALYKSQFSVIMADNFGVKPTEAGVTTAIGAIVGVVTNALIVGQLNQRFRPNTLIIFSLVTLSVSFFLLPWIPNYFMLVACLVPVTIASTVLYTMASAKLSSSVVDNEAGTAVSISHSLRSLTGIVIPPLGASLLANGGLLGVGVGCSVLTTSAALLYRYLSQQYIRKPKAS